MKKLLHRLLIFILLTGILIGCAPKEEKQPVDYVNPYIGNISHLLVPTFPTVHLPNSFLRVYPHRNGHTDVSMEGLPLIALGQRSTWAFQLSPFQGSEEDIQSVISYSYDNEEITPYSWSVFLDEQQTEVTLGVSHQSAMYRVDFKQEGEVYLVLNSGDGMLQWDGEAISGFQSLGNNTKAYVHLEPDQSPQDVFVLEEGELSDRQNTEGEDACIVLKYSEKTGSINVPYGISFIDEAQAKSNMERELSGKDMNTLHTEGREIWNDALGKIEVKGGSEDEKIEFYTALYRTYVQPVNVSEDGRYYSPFDGQVHDDEGTPFYTVDGIWDSYHAHHPLNILLDAEKEQDILRSFLRMAEQMDRFWLPIWLEINGNQAVMNCNHIISTFLDAYRKGLRDFSLEKAYQAGKNNVTEQTLAPWSADTAGYLSQFYQENGYVPALYPDEEETVPQVDDFEKRQTVPVTLGTAYDEWLLAQMAKELGKEEEYQHFLDRSYNYRNLFNPETDFFHPKDDEGNFIQPFDYKFSGGMGARDYYDENNGWTFRWAVPHNIADLIDLMGGREEFTSNLDALFDEPLGRSKYAFYAQLPDQTGNVGQYAAGNEPSFRIPYLYNFAGQPWKTQKYIRYMMKTWFRNDLMGIPGDEDAGSMSAYVIFSSMGFYPVTTGMPVYNIGSPIFEEITIHLSNGNDFKIVANNNSPQNKYIQSATLNGSSLDKPWFMHEEMINGGTLKLEMGPEANRQWGSQEEAAPPSFELNQ